MQSTNLLPCAIRKKRRVITQVVGVVDIWLDSDGVSISGPYEGLTFEGHGKGLRLLIEEGLPLSTVRDYLNRLSDKLEDMIEFPEKYWHPDDLV